MKFCDKCDNLFYLSIDSENPNKVVYYCRCCGNINNEIIDEGGWHFTELKTPKEIFTKHKNDENYDEFDLTGITEFDIEDMVKNAYITYDHNTDKSYFKKKWSKKNRIYLTKINDNKLPDYLIKNKNKYLNWFA